jgi:hypothetical protein
MKIFSVIIALSIASSALGQSISASEVAAAKRFISNHSLDFNLGQSPKSTKNPKQTFDSLTKAGVNAYYSEYRFSTKIADLKDETYSGYDIVRVGRKAKPFIYYNIRVENGRTILTVVGGNNSI